MGRTIQLRHCLFAAAALFGAASPVLGQEKSVAAGAYTAEQATRGDSVFKTVCVSCHSPTEFTSVDFKAAWAGKQVFFLFDQLRNNMPQDNPGGLSREQYAAVVAYILKIQEFPAGSADLPHTDEELKTIVFPAKGNAAPAKKR
jgi:mono/diheme cytochrome c family protein